MLDLANADLSAVYPGPEHNHLRNVKIERQRFSGGNEIDGIDPTTLKRLRRFSARWRRLQNQWLGQTVEVPIGLEPSAWEQLRCKITGRFFRTIDDGKRTLFEFLPLAWLRTYRQTKNWLAVRGPVTQKPLGEQLSAHGITILLSYIILASVVMIDRMTGPDVTMAPFYMIPPAILTLVVGRRWGTFSAAVAVTCWSAIQDIQLKGAMDFGVVAWNSVMRFFVFLTVVLLLDRVRVEAASSRKADI